MFKLTRMDLFSRLDELCYSSCESATVLCKTRGNPYVEVVHILNQLFLHPESEAVAIAQHFGCNLDQLAHDLTVALDRLPRGASSILDFAPQIEVMIKEAFMLSELVYKRPVISSGHLLLALKTHDALAGLLHGISREFLKINADLLQQQLPEIVKDSAEAQRNAAIAQVQGRSSAHSSASGASGASAATGQPAAMLSPAAMGKGEALALYCVDLTAKAAADEIDEIIGRDREIRRLMDILLRRRQNNPMLTGEAGVGKTAVVEGFARRLAKGEVPEALKGSRLLSLDLGLLQAGASMKGEFENRLKQLLEEIQAAAEPIILFIDEAHTLIGAGGAAGQNDAANLLKPALARGNLRCIAATTYQEYIKYFEKDPALSRRFENILVGEPDLTQAVEMMRALKGMLERHHQVHILDAALEAAVKLSARYIPTRQLPDKAVSVLDTACAKVALSQNTEPAALEFLRHQEQNLRLALHDLKEEQEAGFAHDEDIAKLQTKLEQCVAEKEALAQRYAQCQELLQRYLSLVAASEQHAQEASSTAAESGSTAAALGSPAAADHTSNDVAGAAPSTTAAADAADASEAPATAGATPEGASDTATATTATNAADCTAQLQELRTQLKQVQGDEVLVLTEVDDQAVASVIAEWTGIPLGRMVKDELQTLLHLDATLKTRVIGQDHAIELIAKRVLTSRAQLADPKRPIAVLMLAGPSGVGKTETAHALAELIYGTDRNLITINMSEFQEPHSVSTLKGAPPGYVGYGEGGILTEAVRRRPYSVVLLDEIEKAHHDVHEMFFQIFDQGQMEDGAGRLINFKNCIIILTTNVGDETIMQKCAAAMEDDSKALPPPEELAKSIDGELKKVFPAALLGRLNVIAYYPLGKKALQAIVHQKLNKVVKRVEQNYHATLTLSDALIDELIARCDNISAGARMIDALINNELLPQLSYKFLELTLQGERLQTISANAKDKEFVFSFTTVPNE